MDFNDFLKDLCNEEDYIAYNEETEAVYESLDTRRGRGYRLVKRENEKARKLRRLKEKGMDTDKWYQIPSEAASYKKAERKEINIAVRHTDPEAFDSICYNGGLYKKTMAGWRD